MRVAIDELGRYFATMSTGNFRQAIAEYIAVQAKPADKFSHQPRLYALACTLAESNPFDDDVLYAAAWLHDLGVFVGHRPENLAALAAWDNVAYAMKEAPAILRRFGFPEDKMAAVVDVIRTHQPSGKPATFEGVLLRDADILEQLGAVGILRTVSKVGRDTRFVRFGDALRLLRRNLEQLPGQLQLPSAQRHAVDRMDGLKRFLAAAEAEGAQDS
jgi:uncharacterized protein